MLQVAGSLSTSQDSTAYRMSVGPQTAGVRLGISGWDHSPYGGIPVLDDVALYDGAGQKLAEMNAHSDLAHIEASALFVSLVNAPEGSQLVLRVSSLAAATLGQSVLGTQGSTDATSASSGTNSSAGDGRTSFILSVQEYENATASGEASSGSDPMNSQSSGTPDVASSELESGSGLTASDKPNAPDTEGELALPGTSTPPSTSTVSVRIPTGPLDLLGGEPNGRKSSDRSHGR